MAVEVDDRASRAVGRWGRRFHEDGHGAWIVGIPREYAYFSLYGVVAAHAYTEQIFVEAPGGGEVLRRDLYLVDDVLVAHGGVVTLPNYEDTAYNANGLSEKLHSYMRYVIQLVPKYVWVCVVLCSCCGVVMAAESVGEWVQERVERVLKKGLESLPGGGIVREVIFGDEHGVLQKKLLQTNVSTLEQIRTLAQEAKGVKEQLERLEGVREGSMRLARTLRSTHYVQALWGLGEAVLGIDLNPRDYIPDIACTQGLRARVHNTAHRRHWGAIKEFLPDTSVGLLRKMIAHRPQEYQGYAAELRQAGACDQALVACTRARQERLAGEYEALSDHLLEQNRDFQGVLDGGEGQTPLSEMLQAYDMLYKNILRAAKLKEKADALLQKSGELSAVERRVLAAEEDRLAAKELVETELAWRKAQGAYSQ